MVTKDWILLLVPILCNGITVFILQKFFEKRQMTRTIKCEYASIIRHKIDASLELHAKATRLANESNVDNDIIINKTIHEYVNSTLDVYYYYIQNKSVFKAFDNQMKQLSKKVLELTQYCQSEELDSKIFSTYINEIRDELMKLKDKCIELQF